MTDNTTVPTTEEMNLYYEAYYGSTCTFESGADILRETFFEHGENHESGYYEPSHTRMPTVGSQGGYS